MERQGGPRILVLLWQSIKRSECLPSCFQIVDVADVFLDVDLPKPAALGCALLVVVKAASVNPVDTTVLSPKDMVEDPLCVFCWDACGVVQAVGPDVTQAWVNGLGAAHALIETGKAKGKIVIEGF